MRKKIGHLEQAAFVRPISYHDGRANGLEALQFYNGVLDFTVLKNRCMDIADMRYKGTNVTFLAKSGLMAPQAFDLDGGLDAQSGLMGGFLFTCGLSNAGIRCEDNGIKYPFHGQIRSAPAEGCISGVENDGGIRLYAQGRMQEAVLQGIHLSLKRRIETEYMKPGFTITDVITNEGYRDEPLLLIYHINYGWPLLDEGTRVIIPSDEERREKMGAPIDNCEELVLPHDVHADENGMVVCRVENEELGLGASLTYSKNELPAFGEWRSEASGDYVTGFEPGLCGVEGREALLENGKARMLKPGEKIEVHLKFDFYEL